MSEHAWMQDAACRGVDPDIFFPSKGQNGSSTALAKAFCRSCSVSSECLDYWLGLEFGPGGDTGIVGNTTVEERRRIRRQRKALARSAA